MSGRPADRLPVFDLRRQHAFLYAPRERKQERQQCQQHERQPAVAKPDDRQDADELADIGKHADNAGCEQVFHRIHVAHKTRYQRARLLSGHVVRRQVNELVHQAAAQGMRHLLSEYGEQAFPRRLHQASHRQHAEVEQDKRKRRLSAFRHGIHNPRQNQRRNQRGDARADDRENNAQRQALLRPDRIQNHIPDPLFTPHVLRLPSARLSSATQTALCTPAP